MKSLNLLSKAEMKKVLGGNTPEGCLVYRIDGDNRYVVDEVEDGQTAHAWATGYAVETGDRYGYDCQDENGQYEHSYYW